MTLSDFQEMSAAERRGSSSQSDVTIPSCPGVQTVQPAGNSRLHRAMNPTLSAMTRH